MKKIAFTVFLIMFLGCSQDAKETNSGPTPIIVEVKANPSDIILGDINSPVTIIEFSDFQCPNCFQFFKLMKKLGPDYIENGKVKLIFRNYPLQSHPEGISSAVASRCAQKQNKFWEMHTQLFLREGKLDRDVYMEIAQKINLDMTSFAECLDDPSMIVDLIHDKELYSEIGVSGTPTFIINNEMYKGVPPEIEMRKLIERHYEEAADR